MLTVLVHESGATRRADRVDPAWLAPDSSVILWADILGPGEPDRRLLSDVFKFHELAVEDALAEVHHPKIEAYDNVLYLILHGITAAGGEHGFTTHDVDFFLGRNFLVTVRNESSRSVEDQQEICARHSDVLAQGPGILLHRIVDTMVDRYRPEADVLEDRLELVETLVFEEPRKNPLRAILELKRDIASLRRVALPQRDAIGRLARREFPQIGDALSYRFRDVYDNLVRLTDEAVFFQDRVSGLLEAYLSAQSNRLNQVMKVLTVISTIFMPLTVLTSMYGMNVPLPHFWGGDNAQFWWLLGIMVVTSGGMLWVFRRMEWL